MIALSPKAKSILCEALDNEENVALNASAESLIDALKGRKGFARLALIDPPYNRRTKFHHYNDSASSDSWAAERISHCSALHEMLAVDGSLWMHIDDAELCSARVVLDQVFGRKNFLATIVWQKTVSRDNRMAISTTHEYVLAYAKDKKAWSARRNKVAGSAAQESRYSNPDDDPRGPWTSGDLTAKAGPGRRKEQFYDLTTPSGRIVRPSNGTAWRFTRERMEQMIEEGRIYFGSGNRVPRLKRFLSESMPGLVPNTWWSGDDVGTADTAKRHLKSMFPHLIPFETPKPEALAARIIEISTSPGDRVVDIYGGSGTTAAVSHKLGRRWITCEREQRTFNEFTKPRLDFVVSGKDCGGIAYPLGAEPRGKYTAIDGYASKAGPVD
jgi:adenine-specific DNA-methyltransferase